MILPTAWENHVVGGVLWEVRTPPFRQAKAGCVLESAKDADLSNSPIYYLTANLKIFRSKIAS